MKVVFMGTPELAAVALQKLIESRHEVLAVVTQPDKASGRGRSVKYSPVKEAALEANIPVLQPVSIKNGDCKEEISSLGADIFVVAAFSQLLPKWFLEIPPYGCINIHPSLLPKYRGASPLRGPIIEGDKDFGVTIMKMAERLDAGDILLQKVFPMGEKETILSLTPRAAEIGADMLLEALEGIENGTLEPIPQNDAESTYIRQLEKEDGKIHFEDSAESIERQIRACDPWPSAFTKLSGKTFKIWDADVVADAEVAKLRANKANGDASEEAVSTALKGSVVYADKKSLYVKCGDGCLKLNEVQMEGKKRMGIEEFLRGKKLEEGFLFGE